MYYSYYFSAQINDRFIVSNIDDQQFNMIIASRDKMNCVLYQIDYFTMLYMNYLSFVDAYNTVSAFDSLQFVKYNALYINFLNGYYTWWEFVKNHNLCNEEINLIINSYKDIKTCKYVHRFRNYSVHSSQIIKNLDVDLLDNIKSLNIDIEGVINDNNTGRNLADMLLEDASIEAGSFALEGLKVLNDMMHDVYLSEKSYLDDAVKYIGRFLPKDSVEKYNTVICSDDQTDVLPIGWFLKLFDEKIKIYNRIFGTSIS